MQPAFLQVSLHNFNNFRSLCTSRYLPIQITRLSKYVYNLRKNLGLESTAEHFKSKRSKKYCQFFYAWKILISRNNFDNISSCYNTLLFLERKYLMVEWATQLSLVENILPTQFRHFCGPFFANSYYFFCPLFSLIYLIVDRRAVHQLHCSNSFKVQRTK